VEIMTRNAVKVAAVIITAGLTIDAAHAQNAQALLQHYSCYICHADRETRTGPAYVDMAAKYRGNPNAPALLVAVVRQGSHGTGPWHMPPHPEVSEADARVMVRYILSLRE
jgi:cytochrome c